MIDLTQVEPRLYDAITIVVEKLATTVDLDPDRVLIVGAACRDLLHAAFGHAFALRATTDTDVGIAVSDWTVSERIDARFRRIGSNGIRYRIGGLPVDIMPFGGVEDPDGVSRPAARGENLVVFGFRDVHERAIRLTLPNGMTVRLPQPAGYTALKMRSWIDRSAYGEYRDANDLALAAFWYQESGEIRDRLFDTDAGFELLTEVGIDVDLAATRLLAFDAADQLTPRDRADLSHRWVEQSLDLLARYFTLPTTAPRAPGMARRQAIVAQLSIPPASARMR